MTFFYSVYPLFSVSIFFFFNDTATTEIYTLSLHDALPICIAAHIQRHRGGSRCAVDQDRGADRKSTRLNSSHTVISYAVFCLKKKKETTCTAVGRIRHVFFREGTKLSEAGYLSRCRHAIRT